MDNKQASDKQSENNNKNNKSRKDNQKPKGKEEDVRQIRTKMLTGQNGMNFEEFVMDQENYQKSSSIIEEVIKQSKEK